VGSDEAGSSSRVEESDEKRGADSTPLNVPSAEPQSPIKDVAITEEKQIEKIPTEQTIQEAPADQLENNEDQEAEPLGTEGGLTPDNATLLAAVKSFQAQNLAMGCAKVLEELKAYYGWELSKMRLKKCMNTYHLNTEENESKIEEAEARPPKLPPNPLQAQLKCVDMVLYGRGECNFGVTPNPDMGPVLDVSKTLFFYLIINLLFFRTAKTQSSRPSRCIIHLLLTHPKFSISGLSIKPAPRLLGFALRMSQGNFRLSKETPVPNPMLNYN
jgi:hypothetical protein